MRHEEMAHVPATLQDWSRGAKLFDGLGEFHRPITTSSSEAQKYFDQGMRFMWAFNHDEATRSFARAAELAHRYPTAVAPAPPKLRAALIAYAAAMKQVATHYPQDLDVQTWYAEALMNTNAWKLWSPAGQPAAGTNEIVATLESVLERDPRHPGANHYYVHALEASPHPDRAVDAAEANRAGIAADEAYANGTQAADYYPVMYTAHKYQFLAYSASMQGRRAETLALPAPDPRLPGLTGAFLYARAVALAAKGRLDEARTSVADLQKLMAALPANAPAGQNALKDVLGVALPLAQARIAATAGKSRHELALLQQAVDVEDRIAYDEPKNGFFPSRHELGASAF